jgi:endonuclease YncB( thermonuclease family)
MLKICAIFVLVSLSLVSLPLPAMAELTGRVRVIDADTWDVGRERVRLFGIDSPEIDQMCGDQQGRDWACGVWATDQVRALYGGRRVTCERLGQDRYGRTVARCFVDGKDVAREMVAQGLAFAFRRYSMDYDLDEKGAAVNLRGLHASQVQSPADFRAAKKKGAPTVKAQGKCLIKGNISSKGVRIYHVPGQRHYANTRISRAKGERWFCSESEARAAGWRASRR